MEQKLASSLRAVRFHRLKCKHQLSNHQKHGMILIHCGKDRMPWPIAAMVKPWNTTLIIVMEPKAAPLTPSSEQIEID